VLYDIFDLFARAGNDMAMCYMIYLNSLRAWQPNGDMFCDLFELLAMLVTNGDVLYDIFDLLRAGNEMAMCYMIYLNSSRACYQMAMCYDIFEPFACS
jgi:hypothetical protein